jgi:3D-(3,5/4)-trihydroxycyclohexane-1,2-dione acylhydrolase (decyclizing)
MGYECAAGFGAKLASPDREIWVMVGDGNYLMMNSDIITAIQEGVKYNIVLINNNGFGSIGSLSQSLGSQRFGTKYRYRDEKTGQLNGAILPVDLAANARSLGAEVIIAANYTNLKLALIQAKISIKTTVIVVETGLENGVPGHAWWEVAVAEVSEDAMVQEAYTQYKQHKKKQKFYW